VTTVEEFRHKSWRGLRNIGVGHKSEEELRQFVIDFLAGRIFTSAQIPPAERIELVFMPLVFGALVEWPREDVEQIGILYEYLDKAAPRSVNGMPSFFSFRMMHVDDWERCAKAIIREQERQGEIEV
jgi:hypothetical protein